MNMQKIIAYVPKLSFALKTFVEQRSNLCDYVPPSGNKRLHFSCNTVNHHIITVKEKH